ncbi:16S rRNA m(7)G-527 methyltransferase [Desulfomicrobium apsheronum]|uniref:Ribosomal RNA small subunit methyltransferase G n=1 Tax=Desulfomicrobium apsheronum TaxID=52560 RepID=A0A1I3SAD2_9BACT|nr:16S rRNA (guanine(527)-N(7))-methyltransferase RsmG [Desulfomicrobium apsheronum]SFJ54932.1 16S rRNA m(7)G-527 methyltransferase [Desulfomicrobium apsheronum]
MNSHPEAREVAARAKGLGRVLTDDQARLLSVYLGLLVKWNARMNLVGPSTWTEILDTLIQDSWHLADLLYTLGTQPTQTLDLGAGAGLPGIPLRVFWQSGEYYLVEPRQKRAIFMEQAVAHMKLPLTKVICARMEALPPARRAADLIVSRAFMPWRKLLAEVKSCLAPQGRVLVMSNESSTDTVEGYSLELVREYPVAGKKRYFRLFALGGHDF